MPQSSTVCLVRNKFDKEKAHYIEQIDSGYQSNFPVMSLTNALGNMNYHRKNLQSFLVVQIKLLGSDEDV